MYDLGVKEPSEAERKYPIREARTFALVSVIVGFITCGGISAGVYPKQKSDGLKDRQGRGKRNCLKGKGKLSG